MIRSTKESHGGFPWLSKCMQGDGLADRVLQALPGTKRGAGRSVDLDFLPGPRVTARARLSPARLEAAETGDLNFLPTLQRSGDNTVLDGKKRVHRPRCLSPAEVGALR